MQQIRYILLDIEFDDGDTAVTDKLIQRYIQGICYINPSIIYLLTLLSKYEYEKMLCTKQFPAVQLRFDRTFACNLLQCKCPVESATAQLEQFYT